jgi:hypothetical protein
MDRAPPPDMVAYTWAGLTAWRSGAQFAVHWQEPGSPVHYDPGYEHELTLLPAVLPSCISARKRPPAESYRVSSASIDAQPDDLVGDPSDTASGCHVRRDVDDVLADCGTSLPDHSVRRGL